VLGEGEDPQELGHAAGRGWDVLKADAADDPARWLAFTATWDAKAGG
jgi:hypothetical protein